MTASRRHSSKLLLIALLALGSMLLWSTLAEAQTTPRILVSNAGQSADDNVETSGNDHAQLFHTGNASNGYILTSVLMASEDPDLDDFDVEVCEADDTTEFPTSTCTALVQPSNFAGTVRFTAPNGTRLNRNDNYVVVIKQRGSESVKLDSTTSGGEDSAGLSTWSIKDKFYWNNGGTWVQKSGSNEAIRIIVNGFARTANQDATGRPRVLAAAQGAGILFADTEGIADGNGRPFYNLTGTGPAIFNWSYRWIRVDGDTETNVGTDSSTYQPVDADIGKKVKVEVSFKDRDGYSEAVTSLAYGPIVEPGDPLTPPSTLVSNTGQPSSTANISQQYAMGFRLGDHGQGYDISSVSIDLAAVPSGLTVSLWSGGVDDSLQSDVASKLFDFENPDSFVVGLNEFTAPAGAFAYQGVNYFIVLSGFGASLSIKETTSDDQDAGGEPGAILYDNAAVRALNKTGLWEISTFSRAGVLRLSVEGSRRISGILAANYAQPAFDDQGTADTSDDVGPHQEISSLGDDMGFGFKLGAANRYLVRGVSLVADNTTPRGSGFTNPLTLRSGSTSGAAQFSLVNTRKAPGLPVWTAPRGATVTGSGEYVFQLDVGGSGANTRRDGILTRFAGAIYTVVDSPAPGVTITEGKGDIDLDNPFMAVHGVPLVAMTSNLGQSDNGYVSLGAANSKVVSQGFLTGTNEDGYELLGIGVDLEGSDANGNPQVPAGPSFVSVSIYTADTDGKPDTKLFDLVSPDEYAPGHSFFEAPEATRLEANTTYVLVWRYIGNTWHRLQRTTSDSEDSGSLSRFWVSDSFYRGADVNNLTEDADSHALQIAVYGSVSNATGRPVILPSAEDAGVLAVDTSGISDPDGIPNVGSIGILHHFTYRWIRVDGDTETPVGADSARYRRVEADIGKLIKVEASFIDKTGNLETVTSLPFGPIVEPALLPASTLVSNTGQTASATATIGERYFMGFKLGTHGQGYEISGVAIELAAVPSSLTVSLWIGPPPGISDSTARTKLFDFENPPSFTTGLNEFTAPAGAFAYQNTQYFIVLSDFGASLSIKETTSNNEDAGGETGATLADDAGGDTSVLRLAIKGSQRTRGILASTYAQVADNQEIVSLGDEAGFKITLGTAADRYLIRGVTFPLDDSTPRSGGFTNPWDLRKGSTRLVRMVSTRQIPGVNEFTAPQGATVPGSSTEYNFYLDIKNVDRMGGVILSRHRCTTSTSLDAPMAAGVSIGSETGDFECDTPVMALFGEPLNVMTSNFGQSNNGFHSLGSASTKVVSQAFTTGSDEFGYRLQGFGINIEGSNNRDGNPQVPDGPTSVSAAVHSLVDGKPDKKLFDLISPTKYAAGHSFFEAPPGTHLAPGTNYALVWTHLGGTWHRLQRTLSNGEDSGGVTNFGISDSLYRGADLDNLSEDSNSNTLEIAVYGEANTETQVFALAAGITVSSDALSVNEGGSGSYTVVLDAQPTASVTVDITGGGDVTVNPTSLTFTADNWSTAQRVTVRAAGDDDAVDDEQTIAHTVDSGSASEYVGLSVGSVNVTVTDDDEPEVTVSRDSLGLDEGGSGSYKVVLDAQPTASVTVNIAGGGDVTVSPTSLTFSTTNWGTERTVTVRAAEDTDTTDDTQTITHTVDSGSASEYVGLSVRSVAVTVTDNDAPGVSVSRSTLRVNEGGSGTYTVMLTFQPTAGVTIDITGGGDVTVSPTSLTFSTTNWGTERTVTVRAAEDTDTADDAQTITHAVRNSSASEYRGLNVRSVAVTVTDNDDPEVTVTFQQGSYNVSEGSGVTVRVRLSEAPRRTVDIPLTATHLGGASSADYSGVPSSLRFHGGSVLRSFTFRAVLDAVDDVGESVRFGFGTLPALVTAGSTDETTVTIANLDPDTPNRAPTLSATADSPRVYAGEFVTLLGVASDPDDDPLTYLWTSDSGGIFSPHFSFLEPGWTAPATETAFTANLTLTATDPHGVSASVTVSVLVEPVPQPNAATDLQGTVDDDNTVNLFWTIPDQPRDVTIDEVQVQRWNSRGTFEIPTWDTVLTLPGAATFTGLPELAADTEYRFRIRLTSNHGLTADSRALRVRTLKGAPAPRHFWTQWPTQTSITLFWFTVETAAEYKLEYRRDGDTGWTRVIGDFDHLPSTTDRRDAFGVAAGLECETDYHFRVSARGSGEERNDGSRYPSGSFGAYATTSARTGGCAQEERITNLLVSIEVPCATLSWTPPSGSRDTGYRVERYSYTNDGSLRSRTETLAEEADRVASAYLDCSAEYRTEGAEHVYIVTALDNDPGPDEEGAFGSAYSSRLVYGPGWEPDGPRNVRLTHDSQSSRGLAWDAPWDPWLTTFYTARAGSGRQQVVAEPWVTGYRVERREYRRTVDGDWYFPEVEEELIWSATMTVGTSTSGTPVQGYFGGSGAFGAMTQTTFTYPVGSGSWEVISLIVRNTGLFLAIEEAQPVTLNLPTHHFRDWVLVIDGRSFSFEYNEGAVISGNLGDSWTNNPPSWTDGQQVSVQLVKREIFEWDTVRDETDGDTSTSFTDATDRGDRQYVYRVWPYNDRGLAHYSYRGDWAFNGGDPGGNPVDPPPPHLQQTPQQDGETAGPADDPPPSNTGATGLPTISGTPRVGETLTASTSEIDDADGLDNVSYRYQWIAGGSDIAGATGSSYTPSVSDVGKTIQVRVTFTDDADNTETLTSEATVAVAATTPTEPLSLTVATGDQVQELVASWQAPSSNGGSDVTGYRVQWKEAADSWDTAADISEATETGTTHTITGLTGGVEYAVRVIATNDVGDGPASAEAKGTPTGGVPEQVVEPENTAPTGLPGISGTPQVDETLTADTSEIDDEDGLTNVSYEYQWLAGGSDIAGATGSTYTLTASEQGQTVQVRVTFTDDRGNSESLTSEATDAVAAKPIPLTATFSNVPASHSGSGTTFTFDLAFSENFPLSYITLRDHAFSEDDDGPVTGAQRKVQGSNQTWTITVEPKGNGAITVTLPATTDCNDSGAICTSDGRKLSNSLSFTVSGPGG